VVQKRSKSLATKSNKRPISFDPRSFLAKVGEGRDLGIDGSMDARGFDQNDRDLSYLRADSVRDALVQAGVPAYKIQVGAFADQDRRHEDQIQVMIQPRA
jgi:hypothetical protein